MEHNSDSYSLRLPEITNVSIQPHIFVNEDLCPQSYPCHRHLKPSCATAGHTRALMSVNYVWMLSVAR